jgi:hypothetical protein
MLLNFLPVCSIVWRQKVAQRLSEKALDSACCEKTYRTQLAGRGLVFNERERGLTLFTFAGN